MGIGHGADLFFFWQHQGLSPTRRNWQGFFSPARRWWHSAFYVRRYFFFFFPPTPAAGDALVPRT